eukprot:COSAG01_NODE_66127_length_271_cov_0.604651_2_plen_20_part_01
MAVRCTYGCTASVRLQLVGG